MEHIARVSKHYCRTYTAGVPNTLKPVNRRLRTYQVSNQHQAQQIRELTEEINRLQDSRRNLKRFNRTQKQQIKALTEKYQTAPPQKTAPSLSERSLTWYVQTLLHKLKTASQADQPDLLMLQKALQRYNDRQAALTQAPTATKLKPKKAKTAKKHKAVQVPTGNVVDWLTPKRINVTKYHNQVRASQESGQLQYSTALEKYIFITTDGTLVDRLYIKEDVPIILGDFYNGSYDMGINRFVLFQHLPKTDRGIDKN